MLSTQSGDNINGIVTEGNTNYVGSILGEERDQSDDPPPLEIDNKGGLSNIVFLHGRDIKIYLVVLFGIKKPT